MNVLATLSAAILAALSVVPASAQTTDGRALSYKELKDLIKHADGEKAIANAVQGKKIRVVVKKGNEDYLIVNPDDMLAFRCLKSVPGFAAGPVTGTIVKYDSSNVEDEIILTLDRCRKP